MLLKKGEELINHLNADCPAQYPCHRGKTVLRIIDRLLREEKTKNGNGILDLVHSSMDYKRRSNSYYKASCGREYCNGNLARYTKGNIIVEFYQNEYMNVVPDYLIECCMFSKNLIGKNIKYRGYTIEDKFYTGKVIGIQDYSTSIVEGFDYFFVGDENGSYRGNLIMDNLVVEQDGYQRFREDNGSYFCFSYCVHQILESYESGKIIIL